MGTQEIPTEKMFVRRINDLLEIQQDCTQKLLSYIEENTLAKMTASTTEAKRLGILYQEAEETLELLQESQLRLANLPRGKVSSI